MSLVPAYLRYDIIFQELWPPQPQASQTPISRQGPQSYLPKPTKSGQTRTPGYLDSQEGMTEQVLGEVGVSDHLPEEWSLCFPWGPHVSGQEAQSILVLCPDPDLLLQKLGKWGLGWGKPPMLWAWNLSLEMKVTGNKDTPGLLTISGIRPSLTI